MTGVQAQLPRRLLQVADFALRYPEEMALGTAASIADAGAGAALDGSALCPSAWISRLFRAAKRVPRPDSRPLAGTAGASSASPGRRKRRAEHRSRRLHRRRAKLARAASGDHAGGGDRPGGAAAVPRADGLHPGHAALLSDRRLSRLCLCYAWGFRPGHGQHERPCPRARRPRRTAGRPARGVIHALCTDHQRACQRCRRGAACRSWRSPTARWRRWRRSPA